LKKLGKTEGKSLGRMVSDLLALSLQRHKTSERQPKQLHWISRNMMSVHINIEDKEALYTALNQRKFALFIS
jgi:hypothetical protein